MNLDYSNPEDVELAQALQNRRMGDAFISQGVNGGPVYSGRAALARALMGALGGIDRGEAGRQERAIAARRESGRQAEMDTLMEFATQQPTQGPSMPQMDDEGNALPGNMNETAGRRMQLARTLLGSKNPALQQIALQTITAKPREEEAFTLAEGARRYKGDTLVAENPRAEKPEGPKRGQIRERINGEQMVQEEWDGAKWVPIGGGGRWNPKAGTTVNVNGPKESFKNEKVLRDEFTEASKPFLKVRDAYSQVKDALAGDISAPATLTAATKFMKMLDPESVVRESELNMALKSTGALDRFLNLHNTVMKGGVLTPSQAKEIQRIAGVLYQTAEGQQKRVTDYYTKLATDYELDPARIVRDLAPGGVAGGGGKQVKRTGTLNGRKVVEYSDGTISYAD